jgi:hypothetical protein
MSRIAYIGDEAHAAGWRLAGVATSPDTGGHASEAAVAATLTLCSAAHGARSDPAALSAARRNPDALLLVLPATDAAPGPSPLGRRIQSLLGMEG